MSELNYILKGYKKTLLGIVPQNWEVKSIEDIFITFPNASYSRQQICENGDVKYIHYGDIHTKYTYVLDLIDDSIPTITEEQASRYTYLRNGDLIMTDASEDYTGVGKCIEIVNTNDTKAVSGLHTISLRDTNSIYVDGFRKYLTQITNVKLQLEKRAVGTKVYSISYNSIKSCLVPVPPINEQKKIVAILDIWDKAIELQTKLIEKLELRKRAMMQRLLTGRVRLNGFSGQWRKVKLGELCEITTGSLNADAMKEDGIYPFFTCAKEVYKIDKYAFNTEALLISGNGEHLGYIHYYKGRFNAYQRTYILDKFIANIFFIKFVLRHSLPKRILQTKSSSNTPYIVIGTLKDMELKIPQLQEQTKIANVLIVADTEIELEKKKLSSLRNQKRGLMQQLLTGKRRVKL